MQCHSFSEILHSNSGYIARQRCIRIYIKYNIDTFITLNGYRLRMNEPVLITYSTDTYFTIYVAKYLYPKLSSQSAASHYQSETFVHRRPHAHRIIPIQTVPYTSVEVIWLDANILLNTDDTKKTKDFLKQSANRIRFHSNRRIMINEIKSLTSSPIFLIISGTEAYNVLSEIHSLSQLDTVFIFCSFISKYRLLEQMYDKVVGVFNQHDKMIGSLRSHLNRTREQNIIENMYKDPVSFDRISPSLWWTRLLRSYLMGEHHTDMYAENDMIKVCYPYFRTNGEYRKAIFDFEMNYRGGETVHWYTKDSFLYRIVNRALRATDYDAVYTFRYYIVDLSKYLENLHSKLRRTLCGAVAPVYRGAIMSKEEFHQIQENIGGLVTTKSFTSTSWDRVAAGFFAGIDNQTTGNTVSVVFEILMDSCLDEDCRCGDISGMSNMKHESEVLFDIGNVFRVISVEYVNTSNYWYVKMESNESRECNTAEIYLNRINRELTCLKQDIACGRLLVEMGMFEEALIHHDRIEKFNRRKRDLAHICLSIGRIHNQREQQSDAIIALVYYCWTLQHDETSSRAYDLGCKLLCQLSPPERVLQWPVNSENIAFAYYRLKRMKEARDLYLELVEKCLNTVDIDYLKLGQYLNNLASTFEPSEAYVVYECALNCLQRILPSRHPLIVKMQTCLAKISSNNNSKSSLPIIKIFIRLAGTHFTRVFLIEPSHTVKRLKIRLEKFYHIPHNEQTLMYNNEILDDSRSFSSYNILNEVSFLWKVRPARKTRVIRIYTNSHRKCKLIRLKIQFSFSIFHIKLLMYSKYKYPPSSTQQLFFCNKELEDDTLLYDSLYYNPCFRLVHKVKKTNKKILFHIEMLLEHDTLQVSCDPSRITIHRLKKIIEKKRGIPMRFQRLLLDNQDLTEDRTSLAVYGVMQHTTLSLDLTINSTVTLIVNYNTDKVIKKISPKATIGELKEILNKKFHISVRDQKLLLLPTRNEFIPDYHSILKAFTSCQNDEPLNIAIELIVLSNVLMSDIQVIYSDRDQVDKIAIETHTTIRDLKRIISEKSNIQIQNIKLCANGKTIDTEPIIWSETGIAKNQTVFVYHADPIEGFLIKIRLLNGDSFEVRLPGNATTESLRRLVEYWAGIPEEEQRLFYQTTELDHSNEPLRHFARYIIDVVRCMDNFIFLRYDAIALDHKIVPIEVKPNDIVGTIKLKAEKKLNTSLEQYLLSQNGELLNIYDSLSPFVVMENILYIYPSDTPIQYIYVQLPATLERIPVELKKLMTVKDVHGKIIMYIGLSEDQQQLSFQEHQLDDKNQSLEYYGINQNCILQLIHVVSLRIVMTNDCIFSVTINQFSNVLQLKSIICNKEFAVSIDEQKLIYFGIQLKDDLTIKQCRLENNSLVLLLIEHNKNPDDVLFNHARFDQFAVERKKIWASRLGFDDDDDDDDDNSTTNDDDNANNDGDNDSNNENDDDANADNDDDIDYFNYDNDNDNNNENDDDDQEDCCSDNIQYNNQFRKIIHLFKDDDDDDTDDSIPETVCYRADRK